MSFISEIKEEIKDKRSKDDNIEKIRAVFMSSASGSISLRNTSVGNEEPELSLSGSSSASGNGYHIEFVFNAIEHAREFAEILAEYEVLPKLVWRNSSAVVYVKSSDCICNLLALLGATKSVLALNNEIAIRELRGSANRKANCDTANIEKQVEAAKRQVEVIKHMQKTGQFEELPPKLKSAAMIRLMHPEATYEEMAKLLGLTKSGVVHRLRRLTDLNMEIISG